MYKKPPPPRPEPTLKEAFMALLRHTRNDPAFFKARTKMVWGKLFGQHVEEHTRDMMIRNKRLYVYITNAPLRNQLHMVRAGIRDRLNAEFGEDYLEEVVVK